MKGLLSLFLFLLSLQCQALVFDLPKNGGELVGRVQTTQIREGEDFSDVAERFDVGYYEIFEANPGIDPDNPKVDTLLIIPTYYILPRELVENTVVVNLAEMRLYYKSKDGSKAYIFPVGIGKEDWNTPLGTMTIVSKTENPHWTIPDSIYKLRRALGDSKLKKVIPPGPDNPLGKYALRLSKHSYLIHGTNIPAGVGRRSSAGCIRMYEDDIKRLYNLVEVGTAVIIINQPYKVCWNDGKLYLEAHMPLFEQRLEIGDDLKPALDVVSKALAGRSVKVDWVRIKQVIREHLTIPRAIY